jgi:hypothetical protein
VFDSPNDFYLWPQRGDGLSDDAADYQVRHVKPHPSLVQRFSGMVHRHFIKDGTFAARFLAARLKAGPNNSWRDGLWSRLLEPSALYRKATFGCVSCGDCLQDHLNYAGCPMRWCYKELRNGPCGGSRVDGTCEAHADRPCVWNLVYLGALAMGDDPSKFARVLVPPRDWSLDRTNALANRFAGLDNLSKRIDLGSVKEETKTC